MPSSTQTLPQPDHRLQDHIRRLAVRAAPSVVAAVLLSLAVVTITAAGFWLMLPRIVNTLSGVLAMFYAVVFLASSIAASKSRLKPAMGMSSVGALMWTVPPALVYVACGILYVGWFVMGLVVMPGVIFAGLFYATLTAHAGVGYWQFVLANMGHHPSRHTILGTLIGLQWVAILATWPLFISLLDLIGSIGIKTGWN